MEKITSNRYIIIILLLLITTTSSYSQSRKLRKADEAFEAGEYFKARVLYKKIYSKTKGKPQKAIIAFKLGQCNVFLSNTKKAEKWFVKAVKYRYQDPIAILYCANSNKMNGKYDEAITYFEKYLELVPKDKKGKIGIESCNLAKKWIENPSNYIIKHIVDLNSKHSDFGLSFGTESGELFFTSARGNSGGSKFNNVSGQNFTDIFYSQKDRKGKWSVPIPVEGEVNTDFDEGVPSINKDGSVMYFTSCKMVKNEDLGCKLFFSKLNRNKWGTPERIEIIKDSSISIGHPSISEDELTLYFVANMEGGFGKKDIWKITRASVSASWGKPINLGKKINTSGNELYPFIRNNKILYFASDGHIGLGGLDVFKASPNQKETWKVENMRPPINSSFDDFGIIFSNKKERGFFASSRQSKKKDEIYSFKLPDLKFKIKGIVKNEETSIPIASAKVKLVGSDGASLEVKTNEKGVFRFKLKTNVDYVIVSQHPKYLKGKVNETTMGLKSSTILSVEIFCAPIDKPIELPNIFYDVGKAKLREESKVSLDLLIETLKVNDNITIELGAHTDFRGTEKDNLDLSQRRAQSVVDYLINNGIAKDRLTAKGYGESTPKVITKKIAALHVFLNESDKLSEEFINNLTLKTQKDAAHQINRRTEFKVLSVDYKMNAEQFGG